MTNERVYCNRILGLLKLVDELTNDRRLPRKLVRKTTLSAWQTSKFTALECEKHWTNDEYDEFDEVSDSMDRKSRGR